MLKKNDPKFTLETIVGRMRAGARRARTLDETPVPAPDAPHSTSFLPGTHQFSPVSRIVLQPSFQPRSDDYYHVNDLLKYHDRAFVQNAYRAILKRGPDATGFKDFIDALHDGRLNKIDVLARLRYSAEGRAKRVHIEGLFFPASIRMLYGLPLLGYLLNLLVGLGRLPKSIRSEQQFQAHVMAQQETIAEHTNHLGDAVSSLSAEITRTFSRSLQGLSETHRQQIDALTIEQAKYFEAVTGEQQAAREELLRRLAEMNERFEAAVHAQQAQVFSQLSQLSRSFENALADEKATRERSIRQLGVDFEVERTARKKDLDQLTQTIRNEQSTRESSLEQLTRALGSEQTARKAGLEQLSEALRDEQTARKVDLDGLAWTQGNEQRAREKAFQTSSEHLARESSRLQSEAAMIEQRLVDLSNARQTAADARQAETESFGEELAAEIQKLFQTQQEVRAELVLQSERVVTLLDAAGRRLAEPLKERELKSFAEEAEHVLDAFYLSLENQFRGTRAQIKQRLRAYLPLVKNAEIGDTQTPILDVGCGRGEWLALLSHEGLTASGVDSNRAMIQQCRKLKLKATQADLMDHLQSLPDASVGAVTGFHIIEHLTIETLVRFLNETVRVVKPGGLVIFETPNPQNVLVGTCNFYFDPTHRNPLPSPVMKFLLESRGFTGVEVLNLNPSDEAPVAGDTELVRRFNQYFYGPMDYAVVGRRP